MKYTVDDDSGKILTVEGFKIGDYVGHCGTIGGPITSHGHRIESFRQIDPVKRIFKAAISKMPGLVPIDSIVREPVTSEESWLRKPVKAGSISANLLEDFLSQPYEKAFETSVAVYRKLDKKVGLAMIERITERMRSEV